MISKQDKLSFTPILQDNLSIDLIFKFTSPFFILNSVDQFANKEISRYLMSDAYWKAVFLSYFPKAADPGQDYKAAFIKETKDVLATLQYDEDHFYPSTTLRNLSEPLKNDTLFMMQAIKEYPESFEFASEQLKNDPVMVKFAISKSDYAYQYASLACQKDREILLTAVKKFGLALEMAPNELKCNAEIVLTAIAQNVGALNYADPELKQNKAFMLKAVAINGLALKYAMGNLIKDEDVVYQAVKQNGDAIRYASPDLRNTTKLQALSMMGSNSFFYLKTLATLSLTASGSLFALGCVSLCSGWATNNPIMTFTGNQMLTTGVAGLLSFGLLKITTLPSSPSEDNKKPAPSI